MVATFVPGAVRELGLQVASTRGWRCRRIRARYFARSLGEPWDLMTGVVVGGDGEQILRTGNAKVDGQGPVKDP